MILEREGAGFAHGEDELAGAVVFVHPEVRVFPRQMLVRGLVNSGDGLLLDAVGVLVDLGDV